MSEGTYAAASKTSATDLLGARIKTPIAAFVIAVAVAAVVPAPAGALHGGTGPTDPPSRKYVNPFPPRHWYAGRIDMGVDYIPTHRYPVAAIGDAKVIGSDRHSSWPGGRFLYYELLRGDHAGDFVYVAEDLRHIVPAGTRVSAGETIATALPHSTGLEIGWATRRGDPRAAPCYSEGMKTHSGREMARFLTNLGAEVGDRPGPVPDEPAGKLC